MCGVATIMVEGENCEFSCFLLLCWTYYLIYTLDTQVETVFFIMSSFTKESFRKIYQLSVVFLLSYEEKMLINKLDKLSTFLSWMPRFKKIPN